MKLRFLLVGIFVMQTLLVMAALNNVATRTQLKQQIVCVDAWLFNGFLKRVVTGQALPPTNMVVAPHDAHDYDWLAGAPFISIAHALGPKLYDGDNSLKTLQKGRERGFRIFEVDLSLTADNVLVCYHGEDEKAIDAMRYADYLTYCRQRKQLPLCFEDIVHYAKENPQIFFVLDVKNRFYDSYKIIVASVSHWNIGKSFIPQIYDFTQLKAIRPQRLFAGEIFTSYRSALTNSQIFDYAKKHDVIVVTLTMTRFLSLKGNLPNNLKIFTHPVNDPIVAAQLKNSGCKGIYSNYLTKKFIPELF